MNTIRTLRRTALAVAILIGAGSAALALTPHQHQPGATASLSIELDQGRKWATDDSLRAGMNRIRAAVEETLPGVHQGRATPADFRALAGRLQEQVDFVLANCKLPEAADQQLHLVLERMIEGIDTLKAESGQTDGVIAVVEALDAYATAFDHPDWTPLAD
ncbi:hypothetical protein [Prosthecomicrobium sp. N25]|uniref:hypothetical protein n=1 Tax=Prosthecomicrobium sp. N25 TaxID=3129254 RepID=UPI0030782240